MNKKRRALFGILTLFLFLSVLCIETSLAAVSNVNLKITGVVGGYSSDVRLRTDSRASNSLDSYDMFAPDSPSEYSKFYSSITGGSLAIDSWNPIARTLNLVYDMPSGQSGSVAFSWDQVTGTNYKATFSISGESINMADYSSYVHTAADDSDIYITLKIEDYPTTTTTTPAAGGGGGGGEPTKPTVTKGLVISNKILDVYLKLGEVKTRKIELQNEGDEPLKLKIEVKELQNILIFEEDSIELAPREKKSIEVRVVSPEKAGVYTGKILIGGQEILVNVNVNTKELLFDVGVVIPEEFKILNEGNKLQAQVTLIPMGEDIRLDTTLNYIIKDFDGRTFLTESETFLIEEQKSFMKTFSTQTLPAGSYILGLELTYPNGLATSSAHFEVKKAGETAKTFDYKIILLVLGIGIIILIALIFLLMKRYKGIKKHRTRRKR